MGAERVLGLIMKKLKDYKTDPKKFTSRDKVEQENLKKLLRVYSSLKKKEEIEARLLDESKIEKNLDFIEEASHSSVVANEVFDERNDTSELELINCDNQIEVTFVDDFSSSIDNSVVYCENDDPSTISDVLCDKDIIQDYVLTTEADSSYNDVTTVNIPNTECDMPKIDTEDVGDSITNDHDCDYAEFEAFIASSAANNDPQRETNKKGTKKTVSIEKFATVDGFLLRLNEGFKRLPYKLRAKLEIDFLRRLYEVQDNLGLFDD